MDDDAALRGKIASALRTEFEVFEGKDYADAYKLLEQSELDVLLLGMPIESGGLKQCIELFSRLDGSDIDTLVIVLSSDESKAAALKAIDAGSYDYFIKPIDTDVLRHLIGRARGKAANPARKPAATRGNQPEERRSGTLSGRPTRCGMCLSRSRAWRRPIRM